MKIEAADGYFNQCRAGVGPVVAVQRIWQGGRKFKGRALTLGNPRCIRLARNQLVLQFGAERLHLNRPPALLVVELPGESQHRTLHAPQLAFRRLVGRLASESSQRLQRRVDVTWHRAQSRKGREKCGRL